MTLPDRVLLCECWPRDGLQSVSPVIPTRSKIEMINRIVESGIRRLEVTSFAHPRLLPQFADCAEVLRGIDRRPDVSYVVLVPNKRGFDRFETCQHEGHGADEITLPLSSSRSHNMALLGMRRTETRRSHAAVMMRAQALGVTVTGCCGAVFGCPIEGDVAMSEVVDITRFFLEHGARTIMIADTAGVANPLLVRERLGALRDLFPTAEFIVRFRDTRGAGIANTFVALELGVQYVDASLGASGGPPPVGAAVPPAGCNENTCTEDLVCLLDEMGVETGVDLDRMIENGRRAEEIIGSPLRANVTRNGRVGPDSETAGVEVVVPPNSGSHRRYRV